MVKKVLAVIAGVLVGFIIVFIGDGTTHKLHPPPEGLDYMDKAAFQSYVSAIPTYIMVIMLNFWLLSSFIGGMISALINKPGWKTSALITGSILMAAALLNLAMNPHPTWMWIVVIVLYIPTALLGGYMVRPKLNIPV